MVAEFITANGGTLLEMEPMKHACFMYVSAHFMRPNPKSFMHEISCNNIEEFEISCMLHA